MKRLYVRNAQVVTTAGVVYGGVLVEGERIAGIVEGNPDLEAQTLIDAEQNLLLPGLVDAHVHFSEPGRAHWEGFATGSRAAAAGGITTIVDMPLNASPPTINVSAFEQKRLAAQQSIIDYALWGGLVTDNTADLAALSAQHVAGFKAFMCAASYDFPRADDLMLRRGMGIIAGLGSFLAVHAEDDEITQSLTLKLRQSGRKDRRAWGKSRPIAAELSAITSAIALAEATGVRLHIVHVSSAAGIDLISAAKQRGLPVSSETCPHYLFFTEDDLDTIGPEAKCAPPLRAASERDALWDRVLAGQVDVIASDHSPCLIEEKRAGDDDIFAAWGGISGLQSTLPAMITCGIEARGLPWVDLVRMTSTNPARLFGFDSRKGSIAPSLDADLVIIDTKKRATLAADHLHYKNRHSAYVGQQLTGVVKQTILRGSVVFDAGQFASDPPAGRFLEGVRKEVTFP
ncbi:allantoinase AllB [Devosia sp. YIM 151766]|uniref:allantoinase AllB n=1 Tax=Devosia sp. YIM 151766 TaxID=3017325 RepID=UPI00255CCC28|nr:allantoinase AllB [Devosia sp. YIM 151766]WIY53875.1 allantoinase AllB [Devosia sp. YIM 151766]